MMPETNKPTPDRPRPPDRPQPRPSDKPQPRPQREPVPARKNDVGDRRPPPPKD